MKNLEIKKMSIHNIDGKLTSREMEFIIGGKWDCNSVSSALCGATFGLMFAGPLSPLAAATGIGCGLGAYAGCI